MTPRERFTLVMLVSLIALFVGGVVKDAGQAFWILVGSVATCWLLGDTSPARST